MKKVVHKSENRGYADHGWLQAHHSFSFAGFYDPSRIHFGMLRVLNDDTIAPGIGFPEHPHDNMEIITIPLKGSLEHKDSMGHSSIIHDDEVQIMSAGSGITHSEFNHSKIDPLNLLQIWVFPKVKNIKPRYDQKKYSPNDRINKFQIVVSPDQGSEGLWINQDAYFSLCSLEKGKSVDYKLKREKHGLYLFLIEGSVSASGEILNRRDAAGISETEIVRIESIEPATLLCIEVPMN